MNSLTKNLLTSVAFCALAAAPAVAESHPAFLVTALHGGRVVNKTKLHNSKAMHITYTFSVYSNVQAVLDKKVPLTGSFYKWNSYSTACSNPKQKMKFDPKKTQYGKVSVATQTYSLGCPSGPTVFYGADYKLTNPDGKGNTDHFVSSLIGTFKNANGKYKGTLNIDYSLFLE
jgi:hypothetical protein